MKKIKEKIIFVCIIIFIIAIGITTISKATTPVGIDFNSLNNNKNTISSPNKMVSRSESSVKVIFIVVIAIGIYIIPTIVACKKGHPQKLAIALLNIFLGWTFIGWIGCLIWSVIMPNGIEKKNKYEDLEKLTKLKDAGAITQEEFEIEKAKLLR